MGGDSRPAVVKIGGGLLAVSGALERTAAALASASAQRHLVVVPGGGPFAETVRRFEVEHGLSPTAAHWMAMLGQDQYAQVLVERITGAMLVHGPDGIAAALAAGRTAVLAPYRWMRDADVLPHSWDATGDSVAAFVAGALDADLLVLVKPVAGPAEELTDRSFGNTLPAGIPVVVLAEPEVERLPEVVRRAGG
jgi:5-(aminomethyl)-3-furanmethanol phosphate kinase